MTKNNDRGKREGGTFIVKVEYCQNKTWQGKVTWADENKSMNFRSALELIKLMNEALEQSAVNEGKITEHSVS